VQALPGSIALPVPKVGVDRFPRWKVMRQHWPLTTRTQNIEDCIHYLSAGVLSGSPTQFDSRHQRFKNLPFFITQITWVGLPLFHSAILPPFKKPS
jgi:hypothetical protein